MPIYSQVTSGYHIGELVNMLMKSAVKNVCTVQPLGVSKNAAFIIDVEMVDLKDLKADDLGSWHPTGTKKSYFRFSQSGNIKFLRSAPMACYHSIMFLLAAIIFTNHMTNFIVE